ncbi:S8 family peptidase, partial [Laspinema olomoucense]
EVAETDVEEEVIAAEGETEVVDEVAETDVEEEVIAAEGETEVVDEVAETDVEEEVIAAEGETEVVDEVAETDVEEEVIAAEGEIFSETLVDAEETQNTASSSEADDIEQVSQTSPIETREISDIEEIATPALSSNDLAKTELISRLDNLTQTLKIQANNSPTSSVSVNTALIERLETLTQTLQNQNTSRSISESTLALVSRLEKFVDQTFVPIPVTPPTLSFPSSSQPLVGIIGSGFATNKPDIDYSRITWGRDHIDGDNDPTLPEGSAHENATDILEIIAAQPDNGIGIDGINPEATIWAGRAIGSEKWIQSLVEFVDAARESGQPNAVVNVSLDLTQIDAEGNVTTRYELTPQEREALEYARQHNVLIVVPAGRELGQISALGSASLEFDNVVTVGAATRVNDAIALSKAYQVADDSGSGIALDLVARGNSYEAPAKVTGAISQVWAANPRLNYTQVIDIIKRTATDLGQPNWDSQTGAGLLNMIAAIHLAKATQPEDKAKIPSKNLADDQIDPDIPSDDNDDIDIPVIPSISNEEVIVEEEQPDNPAFQDDEILRDDWISSTAYDPDVLIGQDDIPTTVDPESVINPWDIEQPNRDWNPEEDGFGSPGTSTANRMPVVTVHNQLMGVNETIAASSFFSAFDPDSDAILEYKFYEPDQTPGSGYFTLNGVKIGSSFTIKADQLKDLQFVSGSEPGKTEMFSLRAFDGKVWSSEVNAVVNPQTINGSIQENKRPEILVQNRAFNPGEAVALSTLFSVNDADGDAMQIYHFYDRDRGDNSGYITINGVKTPLGSIYVNASQLKDMQFVAGSEAGKTEALAIRAFDGKHWSEYKNFVANPLPINGTAVTNRLPVISTNNVALSPGATVPASSLFSVQDPDGDAMQIYYFHNQDSSSNSGYFTLNGVKQPRTLHINASQLKDLQFVAGSELGKEQSIIIAAFDGKHWNDASVVQINLLASVGDTQPSTQQVNRAPVVTTYNNTLNTGTSLSASNFFTV